jgi:hypothetical protein
VLPLDRVMDDFQGSLVELAGAVRNAQQSAPHRTADRPAERAKATRMPAVGPDPDTHQAAQEGSAAGVAGGPGGADGR